MTRVVSVDRHEEEGVVTNQGHFQFLQLHLEKEKKRLAFQKCMFLALSK